MQQDGVRSGPRTARRRARRGASVLLLVFGLAACKSVTGPDIRTMQFDSSLDIEIATFTETPSGLFYKDLVVGDGAQAAAGSTVSIVIEGWLPEATVVQDLATISDFQLGSGAVIDGVDEAIRGMRVGGRRKAVVPPHLANARYTVLVFDIQLIAMQ